ncbi:MULTISPECIES: hypothetical protein [Bacillus subtilis group]|uniref:hypothetical protein n=1 Tax=Bacillus subtilis group TaxID=653685 RepID=UPI00049A27C1|nr:MULTISPECIES: hypothetical protein [Bacillus subtilis group]AID00394.1 hypothetical protein Q433_09970 [Bacillus subtilis subsp. subtilis str. OH 131.1]AOA54563.1 hypothetical protein BSHJ0_01991 [Bacillus subtilis]MBT9250412.1 hypothetical protein [Bacillus halotolerans]MEC1806976.1 hypothetical protein [Bacillus subtilis]UQZ53301.1 hypothetical protein C2H96_01740 [Bacillus subtilis]
MSEISIPLSSFIQFTFTQTGSARTNCIRKIKKQIEEGYSPGIDYWKQLRDGIIKFHKGIISLEEFHNIPLRFQEESKRRNYLIAINNHITHFKNKKLELFETGKSHWIYQDELYVKSTPNLGLKINGVPYLLKIDGRKGDKKIDKRKAETALALMSASQKNYSPPDGAINAIWNPVRGKFFEEKPLTEDLLIALNGDAAAFCATWKSV